MRKNFTQSGMMGEDERIHIENDWYSRGLPSNIVLGEQVFIDTSYGFAGFHSEKKDALQIGKASGCYDRSSLIVAEGGVITVGNYCILNGTTLLCKERITIGDHCMLAWGSVLLDSWIDAGSHSIEARRKILQRVATDPLRRFPFPDESKPIVLEDNCWVGFDAVIMPGVRLGRGCVIGCKTIVNMNIPPYAVVAGSPARICKFLRPTDQDKKGAAF
jgi:acetyltransferase-like isoleucine patch superfamily enzyme